MKITQTNKSLDKTPKKYVRFVLTENSPESHRLVETSDGRTEYRMGVGKWNKITPRTVRILVRSVVCAAKAHQIEHLAIQFSNSPFPKLKEYGETWMLSTIVENLIIAEYEYIQYKSKKPDHQIKEILLCGNVSKKAKEGFARGKLVGTYTNLCRDIANTPGGDMTPVLLAKAAKTIASGTKATVKVFDEKAIKKLKMGGLIAVGKGAKDKPKFIVIEYYGAGKPGKKPTSQQKPTVFVGKGITFDTGGLQIKPGMAMYEMHMDMSGGAAVIAAVACIAKLGIKKNVIGLIPAAENAVSGDAVRPGDIYTSMSGKTVEVLHTDAEGRLVLADALTYAKRYSPKLIVDVATLTGAALVAIGQHASLIMTKDRKLEDSLRDLGERCGDYVWPLPLWDEYKQYIKGVHGDIANIPHGETRFGGSITAGTFLSYFTEGEKWVHIDMAPRMTAIPSDKLAKGATGEPTRLLVHIAESL